MSLLTHTELLEIVQQGVISGVRLDHVNAASIDITLGNTIWIEDSPSGLHSVVDLSQKEIPHMWMLDMEHGSGFFDLPPGGFCLAGTREAFNLPDDLAAEYKLKSSLARAGLDAALAMWCDPGWYGSVLTLELTNVLRMHSLRLRPGMKIGQMIFHRGNPVPEHASYAVRGSYNNDKTATPSRGVK